MRPGRRSTLVLAAAARALARPLRRAAAVALVGAALVRARRLRRAAGAVLLVGALAAGCGRDLQAPRRLAALDEPYFRCNVHPVLVRSCAFFRCHGDGERFFRVFGRNRLRIDKPEAERADFLTAGERSAGFDAARAMVDADDPAHSLLLTQPLDPRFVADGRYHRASSLFPGPDGAGENVFLSADDPDYRVLAAWVAGASADAGCVEPGSDE